MIEKKDMSSDKIQHGPTLLTEQDIYLLREGNQFGLASKLGSHVMTVDGTRGTLFSVWAPNAEAVSVIGSFNHWQADSHPLGIRWDGSGIWEGFIPNVGHGTPYKYHIRSKHNGYSVEKCDPLATHAETPPRTASIVWNPDYEWSDSEWMKTRSNHNSLNAPTSIYEMHLGSWRRKTDENNRWLSYRELAPELTEYIKEMGFTHIEFMPLTEHPFYGSWGYQTTGYFAPTSRFGTPQDLKYLIDHLHQSGIGVILDWVPSHFPSDEHGLSYFDGTHLYEHADTRRGFHPDWKSLIFNYDRAEVRSFLISSALYWLKEYHVDGLRVDAVASMLYLDYSRKEGEWIPNQYGGREDLEAITFIRRFNEIVYEKFPDIQTSAEESTDWPMVSRPVHLGGLGFGSKWNMGWMHDTLLYFSKDPVYRKYHHQALTFSIWYAFTENFLLPLSHDEVVHGKGSLVGKMPGDDWQKFANLRLLYGYMYGHPGKKLLFMGNEFGQWSEWDHDSSLDWHLLEWGPHQGLQKWVKDLNHLYRTEPALHQLDFTQDGFEWVDLNDWENSTIAFLRKNGTDAKDILVICNFTPVPRENYRVGVSHRGYWKELLNSDSTDYGGSGWGNFGGLYTDDQPSHGYAHSISLSLPPLSALFLGCVEGEGDS